MSIRNTLIVAIIVSFIAIECAQIGAARKFTTDEYIGKWEDVSGIRLSNRYAPMFCHRRNVMKANDGQVIEQYSFIFNRQYITMNGSVEISNSEMNIKYNGETLTYGIECYDNCNDLILIDRKDKRLSVLVSRNIKPSKDATLKFKQLAHELYGFVHNYDNSKCDLMTKQVLYNL